MIRSTAAEVIAGVDLAGKRAIVTGASSGIGVETARALADAGAAVTLAVRNTAAGERVAAEIRESTGNSAVTVGALDSVRPVQRRRAFVAAWSGPLDILVNNAGVMAIQELTYRRAATKCSSPQIISGISRSHSACTTRSPRPARARIVSVSSGGHLRSPVVFDDIDFAFRDYDPFGAYGQSKTANVLFAVEATRRWAADGIIANALMPGGIATPLQRHLPPDYASRRDRAVPGGGYRLQDGRAGRRDVGAARRLAAAGRCRRPLLRGLQRGRRSSIGAQSPAMAASHRMRSTRPTPNGCGNSR